MTEFTFCFRLVSPFLDVLDALGDESDSGRKSFSADESGVSEDVAHLSCYRKMISQITLTVMWSSKRQKQMKIKL